jgi:hypothetical protein
MTSAHGLLDDLAAIGATVEPAGTQLILRAGPTAIPATLVQRVREAKSDLIAILAASSEAKRSPAEHPRQTDNRSVEARVVEWLDGHPAPSPAGACAWCGRPENLAAVVLPFGVVPGTHTWLHAECWPFWHKARRVEAIGALQSRGGLG